HTDRPGEFETHLKSRTPRWAEEITGIPAGDIEALAVLYGQHRRSYIRLGIGFSRSRNGAHNVHAVSCLPAVTGAWQHLGGGALLATSDLFHLDKTLIEGDESRNGAVRLLDMSRIGPILCGNKEDLAAGPPVSAMLIQNSNPMATAPDLAAVSEGFAREGLFVCVHEQFMTETARMADIVLPATTFLEHDDLYQSYGQMYLQMGRQVISPLGECRSNHQMICDLALRLGADHPGFTMTAREIIDTTLELSGYPGIEEMTQRRWLDCSEPFESMNFLQGFNWPDGKFRFQPDWKALGPLGSKMPRFPDHWAVIEVADEQYPFRLVTPPARTFLNTSFTETPSSRKKEQAPRLLINPGDAVTLGLETDSQVAVGNDQGEIELRILISDVVGTGVVAVESIWPGDAFPGGQGINLLTSAEPAAPAGGAVFHDTVVWVRPC
ncbi:MAG: molybdopterin-dependent oxidoreductase, partial [Gammaproteobacteria bacterium]|nr:molybdopterin-dependent oxidoreductase [Gammaproteobacteria bacterium]